MLRPAIASLVTSLVIFSGCSSAPSAPPAPPSPQTAPTAATPPAPELVAVPPVWKSPEAVASDCQRHLASAAKLRDGLRADAAPTVDGTLVPMNALLLEVDRLMGLAELMSAVHPDKPVRGKIIRGRRQYVPAVIRFNAIPSKVLVEVCNLANSEDRKLIQTKEFRQRVAESIVQGILGYYGQAAGGADLLVAVAGG